MSAIWKRSNKLFKVVVDNGKPMGLVANGKYWGTGSIRLYTKRGREEARKAAAILIAAVDAAEGI